MNFQAIRDREPFDAHRPGLAGFLRERGLTRTESGLLVSARGRLAFAGHWTDLRIDSTDKEGEVGGSLMHATLHPEEIGFVHDLCVAARWLVVNHQGGGDSPIFVVPARNHDERELSNLVDPPSHCFVESADEMRMALQGSFGRFIDWRKRVMQPSE